jgi:hypothetical protein
MEALHPQKFAAEYLGISERTAERWRVTGQGPEYVKLGKKVFYTETALAAFVERNRRQSTSEQPAA